MSQLLQRGNTKLGPLIHNFSLPTHVTCPGQSATCAAVCYADDGFYNFAGVAEGLRKRYNATHKDSFVPRVVAELRRRKSIKIVRIHVSGDFYSAAYVQKWIEIAQACPHVVFYAYTRSWRIPAILPALRELAALKNVRLWWSTDAEMHARNGAPPRMANTRVAYMATSDEEDIPEYTDLVFRTKCATLEKYRQGRLICPAENGMQYVYAMTCSSCALCQRARPIPKRQRDVFIPERVAATEVTDASWTGDLVC
jgi:hypothetical protein